MSVRSDSITEALAIVQIPAPKTLDRLFIWGPFISDAVLLTTVAIAVHFARFGSTGGAVDVGVRVIDYRWFAALVISGWLIAVWSASGREPVFGLSNQHLRGAIVGSMWTFAGLAVGALALQSEFSRFFVFTLLPVGFLALIGNRFAWEAAVRSARARGHLRIRAVIVGTGESAHSLARTLSRPGRDVVDIVAVTTLAPEPGTKTQAHPRQLSIRDSEDVARVTAAVRATAVIADVTTLDPSFLQDLSWSLEASGAQLVVPARLGLVASSRMSVVSVSAHPYLAIGFPHLSTRNNAIKRGFDVSASALGILVISPLLLALAVAIKFDSPGPVLFRQHRVGRNGTLFPILKFRSMVDRAEDKVDELARANEGAGPLFKMRDDPRVTRVGRVLRRWSLDELPQLVNVLRGQMSLVGPRPALPREVAEYGSHELRRLNTRPGLTGLWQVSGRSDLDWDEGLRLDLTYVENWSLTGDLIILLRTVGAVLAKRGAY